MIKMYFVPCGSLTTQKQYIIANKDYGQTLEIPVYFYVIEHPNGTLLFDTGMSKQVVKDARAHWGDVVDIYKPNMAASDYCTLKLSELGYSIEEINFVILSHLHLDHAGAIGEFPNAKYIVHRKELAWAYTPDYYQKGAYIRADFDKDVDWLLIDNNEFQTFDLFGDNSVQIWFTPGHTPGHISLFVDMGESRKFLLCQDCCYTEELLNNDLLPGLLWSQSEYVKTIQRIRHAKDGMNAKIVVGHDISVSSNYKMAPEFYYI